MSTKDYGMILVIGVVMFALMVGFALWEMIAPTWSNQKTWAVLLACIGISAIFGVGIGGFALHNLQENLAGSREEKRLARFEGPFSVPTLTHTRTSAHLPAHDLTPGKL